MNRKFAAIISASFMLMPYGFAELQNVQAGSGLRVRPVDSAAGKPANQTDVAVTVYNNNVALVRDTREFHSLGTGEISFPFDCVASQIQPETVSLRSVSSPGSIRILEQNYEFDLISPNKLMEKYIGKGVKLQNFNSKIASGTVDAELLSVNEGPIYKVGDEIHIGYPGTVVLPEIPGNLRSKPTLVWQLENDAADQTVEACYLTGGISWSADYVLTLAKDEKTLDVNGWVTLANQSGATYENAQLKVVAGAVNRVPEASLMKRLRDSQSGFGGGGAAYYAMREETFGEYHLYTLPRRTTIKENQTKQVSLLSAAEVPVKKKYECRGNPSNYSRRAQPIQGDKVGVFLTFGNTEEHHLGMPLPAGVMRVYQEDRSGALQFAGEDRIKHTPKDEEVKLRLGDAFDIVADRKQTDFRVISDNVFESAYEIKIRNHKATDIVVDVVEPMDGDWMILSKSHDFAKKDARTAVFSLAVPHDGETVLTYSVRVSRGEIKPVPQPKPAQPPRALGVVPRPSVPPPAHS